MNPLSTMFSPMSMGMSAFPGMSPFSGMMGMGSPMMMGDQSMVSSEAEEEVLAEALVMVMAMFMMMAERGGMHGLAGGGLPGMGGLPNYGGGASGSGGGGTPSSSGGLGPAPSGITAPAGSGEKAVQIAQSQLGVQCQNINLPGYDVDGRHTDGCANFVVAVEQAAGRYKQTPGDPLVSNFEQDLKNQGWKQIPRSEARPGDVCIFPGQHTEIVATQGATQLIGNNGTSQEQVGYDSGNWGQPIFFTPG